MKCDIARPYFDYWDDVYAGEAIGIRKVKYITTIRDFHRKKRLKLWQE